MSVHRSVFPQTKTRASERGLLCLSIVESISVVQLEKEKKRKTSQNERKENIENIDRNNLKKNKRKKKYQYQYQIVLTNYMFFVMSCNDGEKKRYKCKNASWVHMHTTFERIELESPG